MGSHVGTILPWTSKHTDLLILYGQVREKDKSITRLERVVDLFADGEYKDQVSGTVGFPAAVIPFNDVYLVTSDCPINYSPLEQSARRKREVRSNRNSLSPAHRQRRAVITYYDVSICDSIFTSSSLAR